MKTTFRQVGSILPGELLTLLMAINHVDIKKEVQNCVEQGWLTIKDGKFEITGEGEAIAAMGLNSQTEVADEYRQLAKELLAIYPKENCNGKKFYDSEINITQKIAKFMELTKGAWTLEQIKEGVKRYIADMKDNENMRGLKYLILCTDKTGVISSDLTAELETLHI